MRCRLIWSWSWEFWNLRCWSDIGESAPPIRRLSAPTCPTMWRQSTSSASASPSATWISQRTNDARANKACRVSSVECQGTEPLPFHLSRNTEHGTRNTLRSSRTADYGLRTTDYGRRRPRRNPPPPRRHHVHGGHIPGREPKRKRLGHPDDRVRRGQPGGRRGAGESQD